MPDGQEQAPQRTPPSALTRLLPWLWGGYWLFLFVVMHLPRPPGIQLVSRLGDKVVHAAAYLVLVALGGWTAWRRGRRLDRGWFVRWWVVYAAYAAADELLQPLVGRVCQLGDWLADVTGAALGLLLVIVLCAWASPPNTRDRAG